MNRDEILGFETDTVWGIGAHPLNRAAIDKIYELKGRDRSKPLILMSSKIEYLLPYVVSVPSYAHELIDKYFPGALTLIFQKSKICPNFVTAKMDTVGVRIPDHKGFIELAENFEGKVLATTSLNFSNQPPVADFDEAVLKFGGKIKLIKPENSLSPAGVASTVVLCTGNRPVVLRQGNVVI